MACSVWCLYGLPGSNLNSRKLRFSSFHTCVRSGSMRLSHAETCESLCSLSTEITVFQTGVTVLPPSPSSHHYSLRPVTEGHTAPVLLVPQPILSYTCLHTLAIHPQHTARFRELTKLLPVNWSPANLLLGSSWLCESSHPAAQLFHRGRYGWTQTPVQRQLHKLQGYCLAIGSQSLPPPSIIWSISHTSSGAHISAWFGELGICEPVRSDEVCSALMCVCMVKLFWFLFASLMKETLPPAAFIGILHNGMLVLAELWGATNAGSSLHALKANQDISLITLAWWMLWSVAHGIGFVD